MDRIEEFKERLNGIERDTANPYNVDAKEVMNFLDEFAKLRAENKAARQDIKELLQESTEVAVCAYCKHRRIVDGDVCPCTDVLHCESHYESHCEWRGLQDEKTEDVK